MRLTARPPVIRCLLQLGLLLCILAGWLPAHHAQAQDLPWYLYGCYSWYDEPGEPVLLVDPQAAAVGELLTGWTTYKRESNCTAWVEAWELDDPTPTIVNLRADQLVVRLPYMSKLAGMSVIDGGQSHTVYTLPNAHWIDDVQGVGYILKARHFSQNTGGAWSALNLVPGVDYAGIGYDWSFPVSPPASEIEGEMHAEYQIALVKIGDIPAWPPDPDWLYFPFIQDSFQVTMDSADPGIEYPPEEVVAEVMFNMNLAAADDGGGNYQPPSEIDPQMCLPRTPGVKYVMLDAAYLSDFDVVGSTAREIYFSMFWDCTHGAIELMEYEFLISSGKPSPDAAQGVLPQERSSGAQGVGIQVLQDRNDSEPIFIPSGTYQPIEFGELYHIYPIAINPGGPSGFELPLMARYYQTGPDMSAGSVEAGLTIVLTIY